MLTWGVVLTAWQSHRAFAWPLLSRIGQPDRVETATGWTVKPGGLPGELKTGWLAPAFADCLIGVVAPFLCYACVHAPSTKVWAIAIGFHIKIACDILSSLLVNVYEPASEANPLNTLPRASRGLLPMWLGLHLIIEAAALRCLLDDTVPAYMEHEFLIGTTFELSDGPLGGYWVLICLIGWGCAGVTSYAVNLPKTNLSTPSRRGGGMCPAAN